MDMAVFSSPVYPRVKVRASEQEDCISPQNDSKQELFSKVENKRHLVKDSKPNVRASSVPRPRAVLSSPDNDGMIGSRNKLVDKRGSALKEKKVVPGRTKLIIPIKGEPERPLTMANNSSDKASKSKSDQKQRKSQEPVMSSRKATLRVRK
ncbi:hypothetical protein PanWU01x14_267590 [Parasponia andersonii]|uniref:Uncharacterized protein n=1 Tax=Parasponia andersonii TaxID=3476 RepID=A0A2P5B6G3_PARAD|nr:hypothetical protein PanWU01x14_267590 [Parasponia andersonii]